MRAIQNLTTLILILQTHLIFAKEKMPDSPPPNLEDKGIIESNSTKAENASVVRDETKTLPEKVRNNEPPPAVTIRVEGNNTIEEYRQSGKLYMIRVVPKRGIPYTFLDTDNDGRLEGDPDEDGSVQPNYYTIYEWE